MFHFIEHRTATSVVGDRVTTIAVTSVSPDAVSLKEFDAWVRDGIVYGNPCWFWKPELGIYVRVTLGHDLGWDGPGADEQIVDTVAKWFHDRGVIINGHPEYGKRRRQSEITETYRV